MLREVLSEVADLINLILFQHFVLDIICVLLK